MLCRSAAVLQLVACLEPNDGLCSLVHTPIGLPAWVSLRYLYLCVGYVALGTALGMSAHVVSRAPRVLRFA